MADEAALPEFLDPALDYLASVLPPQVYSITTSILYYAYALLASAFHAAVTIIKTPPAQWDAERLLPPIITLLASYLALLSFYRTTGWMIRTAFAFVKWGFILSTLGGLAGYILANANADGAGNGLGALGGGVLSTIGGVLLKFLDPNAQNNGRTGSRRAGAGPGSRTRSKTAGQRKQKQDRPKAWDSWDKQRDWQYQEGQNEGTDDANVQEVIGNLLGGLGKAAPGWWEAVKNGLDQMGKGKDAATENGEAGSSSRRKGKASKSR